MAAPLPGLVINYEDLELQSLAALADWAWAGIGTETWLLEHRKTLTQAVDFAFKPFHDAVVDGIYRITQAGCGDFTLARLRRAEAAGRQGFQEAAEAILATGGDPSLILATLSRIATTRVAGPTVQGQGRWSAFGYLETAVSTGLTRQRADALRGQRVFR